MTTEDIKTDQHLPGVFKIEHLFSMMRAYCLEIAPYSFINFHVPAVVNAFMKSTSNMNFAMSGDIPPVFSGQGPETFGRYLNHDPSQWPPAGSSAWFTLKFMCINDAGDINRLGESLHATAEWMLSTGYLSFNNSTGYLPTKRLLDEKYLKFER